MAQTSRELVVYGAGGHARVVADLVLALGHRLLGFLDDTVAPGTSVLGARVLGNSLWLEGRKGVGVALGIGDNRLRAHTYQLALAQGADCPSLVHPRATVSLSASLGAGTCVMAGAVVNPEAEVGLGVIVNTGAVIEHECPVGDFAHLSPNATLGGRARVGAFAHLGLCACVLPGVSVGEATTVGAGAVVNRDLPSRVVAVGVPARILQEKP
jgi:sugar O-acyltransferase (sialic acid O-acetyltransferase NeuD family)